MKRFIAILTVCFVLVSSLGVVNASADADAGREILASIKPRIPSTEEFKDFSSSVQTRHGRSEYQFYWENSSDDGSDYKSMNVTASADGIITSYSYYDSASRSSQKSIPAFQKLSSDEAMKLAKEHADTLNPMLADEIKLSKHNKYESLTSDSFSFKIQRVVNGIPVHGDTGYISVSDDALILTGYNISYTPSLSFPEASAAITPDAAKGKYIENIGMELVYQVDYKEDKRTAYLAYIPAKISEYIDAFSGEAVSPVAPMFSMYSNDMADKESAMSVGGAGGDSSNRFTEAELAELENLAGLILADDAQKQLRSNKLLALSSDMKLEAHSVSSDTDKNYYYNFSFSSDGENKISVNVRMNAQTGEILSVRRYGVAIDETKAADESVALKIASALAPSHCKADGSGEYRLKSSEGNSFEFVRYIHDVPYYSDGIYLTINPADNTIVNYSISRLNADFPKPNDLLSAYEASQKLFEQVDYSLCYYPTCSADNMAYCDGVLLVYILDENKPPQIYADSGKLISYENEPEIGKYTDVADHYAEKQIQTLAAYGIGFESSEFLPDSVITQKEFVALLTDSVLRRDPIILHSSIDYSIHYRRAAANGIVLAGEEAPDSPVTRELAAVYMIRAAGYGEVAAYEDIYVSEFTDVTKNKGYISLLGAMGVISGYNGCFNPQKSLTRADAMIMIYNWLSR